MKMQTITCKLASCNNTKEVRSADVARGWGLFCSKACKAKHQNQTRRTKRPARPVIDFSEHETVTHYNEVLFNA